MRRKNAAHQQDIDDLKRQNDALQTQSEFNNTQNCNIISYQTFHVQHF